MLGVADGRTIDIVVMCPSPGTLLASLPAITTPFPIILDAGRRLSSTLHGPFPRLFAARQIAVRKSTTPFDDVMVSMVLPRIARYSIPSVTWYDSVKAVPIDYFHSRLIVDYSVDNVRSFGRVLREAEGLRPRPSLVRIISRKVGELRHSCCFRNDSYAWFTVYIHGGSKRKPDLFHLQH